MLSPGNLRATLAVAALVGTILLVVNQLDTVLEGHIGYGLLLKAVLTYIVPFLVSNYGVLAATRRHDPAPNE
ncbi:MAG: nitrate/nitrite transporter NrtS [Candidatus Dormibacteria bacterium]